MPDSITAKLFDAMLAQQAARSGTSHFTVREDQNGRMGQFYVLTAHYPNGTARVLGYHSSRAMAEDFGKRHIDFIGFLKSEGQHHPWLKEIGETP